MRLVYLETTIVSYLAARTSRDPIVAAHQVLTRRWWKARRAEFELCISEAVLVEAAAGDQRAAARRLELIQGIRSVPIDTRATQLAGDLLHKGGLPPAAKLDAIHIALAASANADLLLTWNCKHIANASLRPRIELICRDAGFRPPTICTPLELLER